MTVLSKGSIKLGLGVGSLALSCAFFSSLAGAQETNEFPDDPDVTSEAGEVPAPPSDANLPDVDSVIGDAEFDSAIPALESENDPELDRPLETIEEFEQRIAIEETVAEADVNAAPPARVPALADADHQEEIGDAPMSYTELTKPLEPIEQFETRLAEFSNAAQDSDTVEVKYNIELSGLEAARKRSGVNLRGRFDALSALRSGGGKAANMAMIAARLREDSELAKTLLASEGWYSPEVRSRILRPSDDGSKLYTAVIDVDPGQRYSFSDIKVDAKPTLPQDLIRENLPLDIGEPIIAERVQAAEAQVAVALPKNGYPFVEIGQRDILLDRDTGKGVYTLSVDSGQRSRFGEFETEGELAFGAEHIEELARFERGQIYDSRLVDDLRKALVGTGLFSTVSVEPRATGEDAGDDAEYASIFVRQDAGPARSIAGSVGYETGEGFSIEGSWSHRNMFPPEGALIAHGVLGTSEQGAGLTSRRSNAGRRDRSVELVAEALHNDFAAYSAYTGRMAGWISYDSTPIWQKKFTYSFGFELLASAEKDFNFDKGRRDRETYYIGGLNGQLGIDHTDDLLDPTKGFRLTTVIQPEGAIDGGFNAYIRTRIDGSGYWSLSDSLVLAGRVRLGTIQGADRKDIAPSRRLYAGGGGSVRGYGYQKLGPLDPNGDPIGGRSLNEASAEVRYRFGDFGIVGFVDAGQSYVGTIPKFSDLRFGAGIGGRYYTNFGPLRVDIATPIDRRSGEGRINIYVSIGQAF